jgi:hypothetical protein
MTTNAMNRAVDLEYVFIARACVIAVDVLGNDGHPLCRADFLQPRDRLMPGIRAPLINQGLQL